MYLAGYIVAGFLMAGAYAWARCAAAGTATSATALAIPLTTAAVAAPVQVLVGDWVARDVADRPAGQARRDRGARRRRREGAPEHLLGWYTDGTRSSTGSRSRSLLSLLAFHNPNATVKGLDAVPLADRPPVNVSRFAFQAMVGIGTLLALLGVVLPVVRLRQAAACRRRAWFYRALVARGPGCRSSR